ncbi:MAG: PEP-CTERM sorting domain-containing protein, partial [Planctomycetota bacterium]
DFDAENLGFEHYFAVQGSGGTYQPNTYVAKNQDDEDVYLTFGSKAQLASGNLYQVWRSDKTWDGTGNGFTSHGGWSLYTYLEGRDENLSNTYNGLTTFDGTNWYMPVTVNSVEYAQRLDLPYNEAGYPASSGAIIQWYDDYDLYLSGDIADPGGYGVSGRYILERNAFLVAKSQTYWAHAADVCYEARTYNPTRNPDGPESPYEWVYDASGDMYVPTLGGDLPGDTAAERAYKLLGNHPAFPDDDVWNECEESDRNIWKNQDNGVEGRSLFVESWRLAGLMLGLDFWNDDPDYFWSGEAGAVAERTWADEFTNFGNVGRLPVWTWNGTTSQWELPSTFDIYGSPPSHAYAHVWGWAEGYTDTPVAGYEALNNFMRYAFDIDALVVEDVDGDGEFDVGDDYVLFSVVDDGLYSKYAAWGDTYGGHEMNMDGQYFDGDTIFLYDGTSVTTFFDAEAGIFFGNSISTATGYGSAVTLWAMGDLVYDLDALDISIVDIGIIPEPSTIFLMIGSASGLAVVAGIMRRKLR